ncbi:MAG: helix-turn-helix domain-containing protein [Pontimonas sp.]|nr:helix-turn-helix domain-containing protein [Pontimonas sp.]
MTELMSFEDVAKRANLPLRTLYYLHQKGRGPKATKLGRHLRVTEDDFFEWINSSPHK